ncbi:MAG: D-alanyl-D-alanine carboxypeptidase [Alphaproteobacteria bacterium]|nr:D-alanyl-D-alanine carboxypeptidase [Alphaproteobacteria bacterium]MDE2161906.1 D-alanyl-D-alanine carboxypeptidase [Alphaproteobacteria bacterium]MDE2264506.1 D-alanyl-D-alanine carboxypeptidase [Alphaproteobacteria bacterium]MDE2500819.1 D-alanyl-D-alanine carboxypeptidase [Alphaproteobacteria bacterium]
MTRMRSLLFILSLAGALFAAPAMADMNTSAEHAVLMDGGTGQILWAKDGFTPTPPASMSKLMTLELLFQRLKDGRVKLTDTFPVSQRAWSTQGSKMFVKLGDNISAENLIQGVIVDSGNDACIVIAQGLGGTVDGFVQMMNERAKELGLKQSHFVNPDGLPDPPGQLMSVADLAKLARHIIVTYPQYYHYFSEKQFAWSGITQPNRNTVLTKLQGADGLKTGYTDASGYGIVASAVQDGHRLILVLNGLRYPDLDKDAPVKKDWIAEQRRGEEAARVLAMAFREFRSYELFKPNQIAGTAQVWGGAQKTVPVTTGKALNVTMQVDSRAKMKVSLHYYGPLEAPIKQGQQVGTLNVSAPDFPGLMVPLYATQSVPRAGIFGRMMMGIGALFSGHHAQ